MMDNFGRFPSTGVGGVEASTPKLQASTPQLPASIPKLACSFKINILVRTVQYLHEEGFGIDQLVTNRHSQISNWVRENLPHTDFVMIFGM